MILFKQKSVMSSENVTNKRHHNPVDSICRKIKTIQMMDQVPNPALQIPKFQSRNFDSPQTNIKKNLEEILKKRTFKSHEATGPYLLSPGSDNIFSPCPQATGHRRCKSDFPTGNATYSIGKNKEKTRKSWLPMCQVESSPPLLKSEEANIRMGQLSAVSNVKCKDLTCKDNYLTSSPNLPFLTTVQKAECFAFQSPVVKRLSLSERGWRLSWANNADNTYDVSLICEEDLLTTIFCACDTERRGKVAVSKIVDYLRHTTSRGSEDSGLEELCNMLDPDKRDISMDLETYHAIMKEWIDDCKRKWEDTTKETTNTEESVFKLHESILTAKKTPARINITSGSLEALGGDVSKGDLETSDLITCVADLQFKNQKLQEENCKLKMAVEALEDTNNRLMEDNEDLNNQVKSAQQTVMRAKSLKEELEEMKISLNISEEKRCNIVTQHKQLEKENQSLIIKISSLQEENIRNALDTDGLQKKIVELSKDAAELQMRVHLYENTVVNKDASLLKRDLDIQELKSTIVEYSSVIETLRVEKNKLVNDMQQMQQELISNGIDFPLIYKFNSSILEGTNSLHSELALAQQSIELAGIEWAALDETLDREVLLLLQGPEQMGENFKATIQKLQEEASEAEELVVTTLQWVADPEVNVSETCEKKLVDLKQVLEEKINRWIKKLHLLEEHRESLDKEYVRMAGNLRRIRTEQLHFRKELSSRQHELQAAKQLQEEAVSRADVLGLQLQEATKQLEDSSKQVKDQDGALHSAWEEVSSLRSVLEEAISEQRTLQAMNTALMSSCQTLQEKDKEQKTAVNNTLREKLFKGQLCGLLCQHLCTFKRFVGQEAGQGTGLPKTPSLRYSCWYSTPLLDALALEILQLNPRVCTSSDLTCVATRARSTFEREDLKNGSTLDVTLEGHKWKIRSVGNQTNAGCVASSTTMDSLLTEESSALPLTLDNPVLSSEHSTPSQEEDITSSLESAISTELLAMETQLSEASWAKDEDTPTCIAMKKNKDKDLNDNVSGTDLTTQSEFCPIMENHKTTPEKELQLDLETDEEMEAIKEQSEQVSATVSGRKGDSSPTMTGLKVTKTKQNDNVSPNEKEMEAEFLRVSLGFKCDLFTLDKRVRLEERSRDLAEENLKKEIMNGLKLLESLAPLCDEDNQAQEIIKKLQKSLQFLNQYAARLASRAEMLGAINQESRVSKAVEVMIQHVENLKRMYTKEHAELEELKQVLLQNERCFHSFGDQDESTNKKLPSSLNFKPTSSLRRVSIAALPRNIGNAGIGLPLAQLYGTDGNERSDKFNRRSSSWGRLGSKQNEKRPSLRRFISTYSWTESEEDQSETKTEQSEPPVEQIQEDKARKLSVTERGKNPSKWTLGSACNIMSSWASHLKTSFSKANKTLWISLTIIVLLAALTSFLTGLSLQRPADAAPVGTGSSWTSLQQLLWPYTELQHNGPPPV
ncbi:inositol 1,4,5-triphosphate receptor associated 2-like isoform X2 [Mauremys reevesii]|uniref:inositol 1,4,5-triphosphate receptor associated 2-like isoform X2 n=1 Tax=Mauremys reevesii TaxID=260615 RepID=UPI00193FB433|nr:inositol 1,4,5-triphosphate receptor associated 2-like isoform X2 [Mauremys reevesii]